MIQIRRSPLRTRSCSRFRIRTLPRPPHRSLPRPRTPLLPPLPLILFRPPLPFLLRLPLLRSQLPSVLPLCPSALFAPFAVPLQTHPRSARSAPLRFRSAERLLPQQHRVEPQIQRRHSASGRPLSSSNSSPFSWPFQEFSGPQELFRRIPLYPGATARASDPPDRRPPQRSASFSRCQRSSACQDC